MKTQLNLVFAALLAGSSFMATAAEEHHPADTPANQPLQGMAADSVMSQSMNQQMQKMQAAHDKAAAAKTPAERQAAMMEGMQTMKDSLTMMSKQNSAASCSGMAMNMGAGMGMTDGKDGQGMGMPGSMGGMGMMDMMMKMMDQQSSMMNMPMHE